MQKPHSCDFRTFNVAVFQTLGCASTALTAEQERGQIWFWQDPLELHFSCSVNPVTQMVIASFESCPVTLTQGLHGIIGRQHTAQLLQMAKTCKNNRHSRILQDSSRLISAKLLLYWGVRQLVSKPKVVTYIT